MILRIVEFRTPRLRFAHSTLYVVPLFHLCCQMIIMRQRRTLQWIWILCLRWSSLYAFFDFVSTIFRKTLIEMKDLRKFRLAASCHNTACVTVKSSTFVTTQNARENVRIQINPVSVATLRNPVKQHEMPAIIDAIAICNSRLNYTVHPLSNETCCLISSCLT